MKKGQIINFIKNGSLLKTLQFNIHYFGFISIFKPRVIVSKKVKFGALKGTVICPKKLAACNLGFFRNSGYPLKKGKTYFSNMGKLMILSHFCLGYGASLQIYKNAQVSIGDCFIGDFSSVLIKKGLIIGKRVKISWDVQIMDFDGHSLTDLLTNKIVNQARPIIIEDDCWLCCRCIVLKNSYLPKGCILASNSFLSRHIKNQNCMVANNIIVKKNITCIE